MIRKYIPILAISLLCSQDIAGSYQFTGLYIIHQSIARYDTDIFVSDTYGIGLTYPIEKINAGEIYRTTYQGPYGHLYAELLNVVLNVTFNGEGGEGVIDEGSYYPTETVENCIADIAILAITDELLYTSNLGAGLTIPSSNILGSMPDEDNAPLPYAGQTSGSISLSQSDVFDYFPEEPVQPTLCDGDGNCFDVILENGETIPGGAPLPGYAGGYVLRGDLPSIAPLENDCADLYVEWHAIDGPISDSGLGDIIGEDEDEDGTDFDRIWAVEKVTVTSMSPHTGCGYNYPIFGDVSSEFSDGCAENVVEGNEGYVWDAENSIWGNFVTWNSINDIEVDDSDHDYDGTDGRLVMKFEPQCIQDINVRHMMLEFNEVGPGGCVNCDAAQGDLNNDGGWNVLDVVTLVNCVLAGSCADNSYTCAGDLNGDGGYNVLDIVTLVNCVLGAGCGD